MQTKERVLGLIDRNASAKQIVAILEREGTKIDVLTIKAIDKEKCNQKQNEQRS